MREKDILQLIYPPEEIYVVHTDFDDATRRVKVTCRVPTDTSYTLNPIPYVTAEQYVRCLSQTCFLLGEHALDCQLISLDVDTERFRQAATEYQIYYRSLALTFHSLVNKGEEFAMTLTLENWRKVKRLQDFILFTFKNERAVISGEMSFVFPG